MIWNDIMSVCQLREAMVDPETGELLDEAAYRALDMEWTEKLEATALEIENCEAEAKAVRETVRRLEARAQHLERQAARYRELLALALQGDTFRTARCTVTYHAAASVELEDAAAVIRWAEETGRTDCVKYGVPIPIKTRLKDYLKTGLPVPGARLVKKRNLIVR